MPKKILMIVGDFAEDYETMVPFQTLLAVGHTVHAVCPGKKAGQTIATAIHDFEGDQTYTEKRGHNFALNATFADIKAADYDALVIPGGMSWEKGTAADINGLVHRFGNRSRVIGGICAAASALAGTGILNEVAHTGNSLGSHRAYPGYRGDRLYRDQPQAVSDGGIVTAPGSAPVSFAAEILKALGLFGPEAEAELRVFAAEHR